MGRSHNNGTSASHGINALLRKETCKTSFKKYFSHLICTICYNIKNKSTFVVEFLPVMVFQLKIFSGKPVFICASHSHFQSKLSRNCWMVQNYVHINAYSSNHNSLNSVYHTFSSPNLSEIHDPNSGSLMYWQLPIYCPPIQFIVGEIV